MGNILFKGETITTSGDTPQVNETAPEFNLVGIDLKEVKLSDLKDKIKILNIFPSIDTGVCAASVIKFDHNQSKFHADTIIINISADLPFAQKRFCSQENIKSMTLSTFRSSFAKDYGLEMTSGPLKGLCSRVVMVLDKKNKIHYVEQVSEVTNSPNFDNAIATLDKENFNH